MYGISSLIANLKWEFAQILELQWWKFYLRKKNPIGYIAKKRTYWYNFLQTCNIQVKEHISCLDAGCGPAGIFIILNNQYCDAIDPLLQKYESQLNPFFSSKLYPKVTFHNSTLESFNPGKQYDIVFSLNAINHVSEWCTSLRNLWEWTKPGGILLLSTDVHRYIWLKQIFRFFSGDVLHPQQHSLTDYTNVLQSFGPVSLRTILLKRKPIFDYYAIILQKPL